MRTIIPMSATPASKVFHRWDPEPSTQYLKQSGRLLIERYPNIFGNYTGLMSDITGPQPFGLRSILKQGKHGSTLHIRKVRLNQSGTQKLSALVDCGYQELLTLPPMDAVKMVANHLSTNIEHWASLSVMPINLLRPESIQ